MTNHNPPREIHHEVDQFTTAICRSSLDEVLREGARRLLIAMLNTEVDEYLTGLQHLRDDDGRRLVVRNGLGRPRRLQTGSGEIEVEAPRVNDRREGHKFTSRLLPPYLRRAPNLENLIPVLYLKGISTSAMPAALEPLLGPQAAGLAPSTIVRMIEGWQADYDEWAKRDLKDEEIVYLWADGIYCNVRLKDDRPCLLVMVGARKDGTKVLLALQDGERESEQSWLGLLQDLKRRGLKVPPKVAVGDGALGFWAALEKAWPSCRQQRCWVHKMVNVLDKLPKKLQADAKQHLQDIWMAATKKDAEKAFADCVQLYQVKYPKACECLQKDRAELLAFYDFPAEHWRHLRTTNVIESSFATIRHRSRQTKGAGSRLAALALLYKLGRECEKGWRRLNGHEQITKLILGVRFIDGVEAKAA